MDRIEKVDIPEGAEDIVIFVHGFGVRWDSRGMFTDIRDSLPTNWGSILFDLYTFKGNEVYITSIQDQAKHLTNVIEQIKLEHPTKAVHIIAHSMGCVVASLARPKISGKVIFLAPPEDFGDRIESYFKSQPNTKITESEIIVPRKDKTISHIPIDFFSKLKNINPEKEIEAFSKIQKIYLVQTLEDEVIGTTRYELLKNSPSITIKQIVADHNFSDKSRQELLHFISNLFEKAYLVDEQDHIIEVKFRIDTMPKDRIRIVGIWVENSKGEVLIAQRSFNKRLDPGKWGPSAAGGVAFGETYEEAAKKEVEEELGVDSKNLEYIQQIDKYPYGNDDIEPRMLALFLLKLDWPIEKFKFPKDEVESIKWIAKDKLARDISINPDIYLPHSDTWLRFLAK